MSTNSSTGNPMWTNPKKEKTKNTIIWVLSAGLITSLGYQVYFSNKATNTIHEKEYQISSLVSEKSTLQGSFDASLTRLDSMTNANTTLQSQLTEKNDEITKVKSEIRSILNKKDASQAELSKAKKLIAELNDKINVMGEEISRLTVANETLTKEKNTLIAEKETLTQDLTATTAVKNELAAKVDVASTLNASNINITPLNVKKSGKQVASVSAKKVDKLLVSFDVDNRIIQTGTTDVYVLVMGPDGQPVTVGEKGTFPTREEGEKQFTAKLPVDMETAKKRNVEFSFAPGNFREGDYKIQIYQNGYLIGQGTRTLKKGGLFS